jgi:hypothetical protein
MGITQISMRAVLLPLVLLGGLLLAGCYKPNWPAAPEMVAGSTAAPTSFQWRPEGSYGPRYVESCRDGVKRVFYIDPNNDGSFAEVTDLDKVDPAQIRWVFILLDGVPYKLFDELYNEGHFRLFYPPAKFISTFPSITDISFSNMYGIPGTSCYESVLFDPAADKAYTGLNVYTSRANELWGTALDYRQRPFLDGLTYVLPRIGGHREFSAAFGKAKEILEKDPQRKSIAIYAMATDAQDHAGPWQQARRMLLEVERYTQELSYRHQGKIGLVMLSDHGNNFVPDCRLIALDKAIRAAGLKPVHSHPFRRPGDVVILRYGLISMVQAFTQNEQDKLRTIDAMLKTEGVEHVIWRTGASVRIARGRGGTAEIARHVEVTEGSPVEYFCYRPLEGDPLELGPILDKLEGRRFGEDPQLYYGAQELLTATAAHLWPDPLWRLWHGMNDHPTVVLDVVGSLALGWFYGAPRLEAFETLNGTHGGLRDWDSVAFFTSNMFAPPPVMRTVEVLPLLNQHAGWVPKIGDPAKDGLGRFLKQPVNPTAVWPLRAYGQGIAGNWGAGEAPIFTPSTMPASFPSTMPASEPAMLPAWEPPTMAQPPATAPAFTATMPSAIVSPFGPMPTGPSPTLRGGEATAASQPLVPPSGMPPSIRPVASAPATAPATPAPAPRPPSNSNPWGGREQPVAEIKSRGSVF